MTLLKFVIAAAVFIVTGPMALRFLMNRGGEEDSAGGLVKELGLPHAPRDRGHARPARDAGDAVKVFDQGKSHAANQVFPQEAQLCVVVILCLHCLSVWERGNMYVVCLSVCVCLVFLSVGLVSI